MKRVILIIINSIEKFTFMTYFIYIPSFELDRGRFYLCFTHETVEA